MALSDYADVVITADSVSPSRQGFGIPLIQSVTLKTASWVERKRRYSRQADVLVDFAADDPEALASAAMFGQNPRPKEIFIGKCSLPPTIVWVIGIASLRNLYQYGATVVGEGAVEPTDVLAVATDANATNDEAVALLVTAFNAVVGRNYTAVATGSSGSQVVTLTATAAGDWFSVEVDPAYLTARMTHADPGVATDLTDTLNETDEFYYVYTLANSEPYATAAAAWCQSNKRFLFVQSSDTRDLLTSTGSQGLGDVLAAAGRTHVAWDYHPDPAQMAAAALIGNIASRAPGSWTALGKRRVGITPVTLNPTQRANLKARHANFYEKVAGVSLSAMGTTTAGPSDVRGFIDTTVGLDWHENDMAVEIFTKIAGADGKLPRTDEGMVAIEEGMNASLKRGIDNGLIAEIGPEEDDGPSPTVSIPKVADMDDLLPRGVRAAYSFKLAGAVHEAELTGVVVQ